MKALILAGGYGTRLQRDLALASKKNVEYKELQGLPKALVPVQGLPLITHWVHILSKRIAKSDIHIVSNDVFHKDIVTWAKKTDIPVENISNDGTKSNETRMGAILDIFHGLKAMKNINWPPRGLIHPDDVMIIAGDTLFLDDFNLGEILNHFNQLPSTAVLVTSVRLEKDMDTLKSGVIECSDTDMIDSVKRVKVFKEKPHPNETISREGCPCFYIFKRDMLNVLPRFINEKMHSPLEEKDATGKFIAYLVNDYPHLQEVLFDVPVYAVPLKGRIDVGGLDTWIEAQTQSIMN